MSVWQGKSFYSSYYRAITTEERSCTMTADAIEEAQSEKMVCGYLFLESPDKDSPKANSLLSCTKTS